MNETLPARTARAASIVVILGATLLCSCAGSLPPVSSEPTTQAAPRDAVAKPDLSLPPVPSRTEEEMWKEVYRRADALKPVIEGDVATLVPAPLPANAPPPTVAARPQPSAPAPDVKAPPPPLPPAAKSPSAAAAEPPVAPTAVEAPAKTVAAPSRAAPKSTRAAARAAIPNVQVTQRFTTENGLPSGRITALYVDDDDAWVGTADAGIARFNFQEGNWIVTKVEDGLASNRITDIVKYKGRVFVATQDGLSIWDGVSWTTQETEGKVKLLNAVFKAHEGVLWVAARTMYGGLLTFDGEKWKDRSTIRPGTVLNNVSDFAFAGNMLWIGTTNRGLLRFDGKDWTGFTVSDGLASNFVYTLGVKGESCYIGGCCGLSAFEDGNWKIYDIGEGLSHSTVNAIAVDGDLVWLGSKKGLGLFDGFTFTNYYTDNGLTDDRITALFVKGNEVWVGTANGLNRLVKSY